MKNIFISSSLPRLGVCTLTRVRAWGACVCGGWSGSWELWWSVSSVDVDGPWSEARAWLLKCSLFCASEPALPVPFRPCRWGWAGIYPPLAFIPLALLDAGLNGIVTTRL